MNQESVKANQITEGVIWKQMLLFFPAIVAGTLLQQFYSMVDTVIIGRYVGTAALAAVGGSDVMVINLLVNFFVGLSSGASIIISQRFGAGDEASVSKAVHTAILLAVVIGAVMTFAGIFGANWLLGLMNTPQDAMEYAVVYLQYYFLGMIPSMIYNMGSGILRAVGDSRHPLYFLMACTVANIFLDILFVVVFCWGVMGAAVATSLSQVICAVLVLGCLRRDPGCCHLSYRRLRFDSKMLSGMLAIGVPAGMQTIFYNVTNVMVQAAINSLGTTSAAAWSTFWRMDGFFLAHLRRPGHRRHDLCGAELWRKKTGADPPKRQSWAHFALWHVHCVWTFTVFVPLPLCRTVATDDPQVQQQGALVVSYLAAAYPAFSCIEIFSSSIRGTGNAIKPTIITLLAVCLLRIAFLLAVTFPHTTHLSIALCYPVTWITASVVFALYYKLGKWMPQQ